MEAKPEEKCRIIEGMTGRDKNELKISWLCDQAGVSRSGYYSRLSASSARLGRDNRDRSDFELILKAHRFCGYDRAGAESICGCCRRGYG